MIRRQIGADLRSHWLSNILLALVCAAAVFLVMASGALPRATDDLFAATTAELRGADQYVIGDRAIIEKLAAEDPAVLGAGEPVPVQPLLALAGGTRWEVAALGLDAMPDRARPLVREGRFPNAQGEALVDGDLLKDAGLAVGDRIELEVPGRSAAFTVSGSMLYIGAERFPADPARIVISSGDLASLAPRHSWQMALDLDQEVESAPPLTRAELDSLSGTSGESVAESYNEASSVLSVVLSALGLLAMVVAGLTIANAVAGRVLAQQRRIGLQKALGWRPRQLLGLYVGQFLLVGLGGAVAGILLGSFGTRQIAQAQSELLGTPGPPFPVASVVLALVLVSVVTVIAASLPVLRALRLTVAEAMRSGGRSRRRRGRGGRASRLPVTARLASKDLFRPVGRTVILVTTIALAAATLSATLYFEETITNASANEGLDESNGFAVGGSVTGSQLASLLDESSAVASWELLSSGVAAGSIEDLADGAAVIPANGVSGERVDAALISASGGRLGVIRNTDGDVGLLREIRAVTRPITLVLVLAGLINLIGTTLLQVAERRRDLAIGKTVGMSPARVMRVVFITALLPAIVGIAGGLALGEQLLRVIMTAADGADTLQYIGTPSVAAFAIAGISLVALAALAAAPTAAIAARIRPVEVLRQLS